MAITSEIHVHCRSSLQGFWLEEGDPQKDGQIGIFVNSKALKEFKRKLHELIRETNAETLEDLRVSRQITSLGLRPQDIYEYDRAFRESLERDHHDATSCAKSVIRGIILREDEPEDTEEDQYAVPLLRAKST